MLNCIVERKLCDIIVTGSDVYVHAILTRLFFPLLVMIMHFLAMTVVHNDRIFVLRATSTFFTFSHLFQQSDPKLHETIYPHNRRIKQVFPLKKLKTVCSLKLG